jgi:RNA recognition motif-containing protein
MSSSTLFIGNLSFHCTEKDILELFCTYGLVEFVKIKRKAQDSLKSQSSYGFIKYSNSPSAQSALFALNGVIFQGRSLRYEQFFLFLFYLLSIFFSLGWASDRIPNGQDFQNSFQLSSGSMRDSIHAHPPFTSDCKKMSLSEPQMSISSAQIHFSYHCSSEMKTFQEEDLRSIFSQFGRVVDVSIKKIERSQDNTMWSVYGFIHYTLSSEGISSCFASINAMNNTMIDNCVYFQCSLSHSLDRYLLDQKLHNPKQQCHFSSSLPPVPLPLLKPSAVAAQPCFERERSTSPDSTCSTLSSHSSLFSTSLSSPTSSLFSNAGLFFEPIISFSSGVASSFKNIDEIEQQERMIINRIELDLDL